MSVTVKSTSHVTTQSTGSNTAQVIPQGPPGVGGGGGAVNSVNGKAGTVVLNAGDVGAEPAGAVAAHVAAADPHPAYVKAASLATVATSGAYGDLTGKPTLGTAAPLDVPASGDASSSQVVKGDDTRLTNARTPTAHTHTASDISDSTTAGRALLTASDASAQRAALGVPSGSGTSTGTNTGDETLARIGGLLNSASAPGAPAGTTDQVVGLTAASSFSTVERWSLASIRNAFVPTYDIRYVLASNLSTDGTLYANSDTLVPSQKAVKTYADQLIAAADVMVFKGVIDCSTNPNYPAADAGWTYRVSVAGKIGGASGVNVEIGDLLLCLTDATASGNQATVGANWSVSQTNIDGAVIGPTSVADGDVALFNGVTGKLIKSGGKLVDTVLTSLSTATNAVITAADSILTALGKLQKQVSDNLTTLTTHTGAAAPHSGHVIKTGDTLTGTLNWSSTQTIASAATTDIGAATSNVVIISGTTTITGLGTIAAGAERCVTFSGALTLTHNATSLILPGGANITTASGDVAYFASLGAGNWRCTGYQKANGQSVAASGGSSNTRWIGAGELIPRATNGAGIDGEELATNKQNLDYLAFDAGTQEYAQASFDWPSGYTTFTATFYWKASSGSGDVVWRAAARSYADGDSLDQAFGTAQSVTDTLSSANTNRASSPTAAVTPSGTVAAGNFSILQIDRDATNGSDTLAVDALLSGVRLVFA